MPGEPPAAQGCRGEGDRLCDAVVVALGAGVIAGAGAGRSGSLVCGGVRSPPAGPEHRRRARRRESLLALPELPFPADYRNSGSSRATRWSSSRLTATACRPATPAPRSRSAPGWATSPGDLHALRPPDRPASPRAGRRRTDVRTPEHASLLEQAVLEQFTTRGAARASRTGRPANGRWPRPPGSAASTRGVVVDLESYARIARVAGR